MEVEMEVGVRGLVEPYVSALIDIVGAEANAAGDFKSADDLFSVIHAKPWDRCVAALRAAGVEVPG